MGFMTRYITGFHTIADLANWSGSTVVDKGMLCKKSVRVSSRNPALVDKFNKYLSVHLAVAEDGGHGDGGVGRPTEAEHPHHHDHLGCQSLVIASAEVLAKFTNVSCILYISTFK